MLSLPYIVFKGNSLFDLQPCAAFENKDKAIEYCKHDTECIYYEVTHMPENDVDINNVVWRNYDEDGQII